jgi:hypothetical protein
MSDTTALEILDLDLDNIGDITDRLDEDGLGQAAEVMRAMTTFAQTIDSTLDGDDLMLYSQTAEMRRSHLAAMAALMDTTREKLLAVLEESAIPLTLSDPDVADSLTEGLTAAGETLRTVVEQLAEVPARPER